MERSVWNSRLLNVLESTFDYDTAMTDLLLPEIAKRYTSALEQNENYRARLLHFRTDLEGENQ